MQTKLLSSASFWSNSQQPARDYIHRLPLCISPAIPRFNPLLVRETIGGALTLNWVFSFTFKWFNYLPFIDNLLGYVRKQTNCVKPVSGRRSLILCCVLLFVQLQDQLASAESEVLNGRARCTDLQVQLACSRYLSVVALRSLLSQVSFHQRFRFHVSPQLISKKPIL